MDNQHNLITGYRDLEQHEIDSMNKAKKLAVIVGELVEEMQGNPNLDQRWVAIAKTDLQKGFMALVRSIAKPESF